MTAINRRAFLASAAALAAAPALGQVPSSGQVDVAIIGAGAAGIAAARRVAAAGRRFALIEAGNRIGGGCVTHKRRLRAPVFPRGPLVKEGGVQPGPQGAGESRPRG